LVAVLLKSLNALTSALTPVVRLVLSLLIVSVVLSEVAGASGPLSRFSVMPSIAVVTVLVPLRRRCH
jgi:hypothetical protein